MSPTVLGRESLTEVIEILVADLKQKFAVASPTILVCGLSIPTPVRMATCSSEEINIINPVVEEFRSRGVNLIIRCRRTLCSPQSICSADAVLAMYHDQGIAGT